MSTGELGLAVHTCVHLVRVHIEMQMLVQVVDQSYGRLQQRHLPPYIKL